MTSLKLVSQSAIASEDRASEAHLHAVGISHTGSHDPAPFIALCIILFVTVVFFLLQPKKKTKAKKIKNTTKFRRW